MKAIVAHTVDGQITALATGGGIPEAAGFLITEIDLPDDFPALDAPNAEEEVSAALAQLIVKPGQARLERRS